ncbi:MAG: DNA polymerase III subunit gamma/tau [Paenalcaligenes sp.]
MTYLVLARKWRPRSFDTLIGQDHVVRALSHALSTQRLHHAWLFTGTRGVGKTTLSRILAKALNCETGITPNPCGQCRACQEIDSGRFVDYVELDAASNRGVDEMTQLLEQAVYAPSVGRYKVYMIDEVHMLTGHAFNAMLKTLEEPPAHVKFILATTDPQKIPVTVLSRCLQFNLKQMTVPAIVEHLQQILEEEKIEFDVPGLRLIAQAAAGSMRDALSLTDQAIAYSAGNVSNDAVQGMLGTIDQGHLCQLLRALMNRDAQGLMAVADDLALRGLSYSAALGDLAVLLSQIAVEQRLPGATPAEHPLQTDIQDLAQQLGPDFVQLFYSVAVHSRKELSLAPDEYAGFVMGCLRMLALMPGDTLPSQPEIRRDAPVAAPAAPVAAVAAAEAAPQLEKAVEAAVEAAQQPTAEIPAPVAPEAEIVTETPPTPVEEPIAAADHEQPVVEAAPSVTPPPVADVPAVPVRDDVPPAPPAAMPPTTEVGGTILNQPSAPAANVAVEPPASPVSEPEPPVAADGPPADFDDIPWEDDLGASDDAPYEQAGDPGSDDSFSGQDDVASFEGTLVEPDLSGLIAEPREVAKSVSLKRMDSAGWPAVAAGLPLSGWAAELARQSEWISVDKEGQIVLRAQIRSADDSQAKARLSTVLAEYFGQVVRVNIEYGATGDATAYAVEQAEREQRQVQAEQDAPKDPFIVSLIREFGAQIMPGSIQANHLKAV